VYQHQQEIFGAKKAIAVSVPTALGTNQFVRTGLQRSKAALKQAASDPKWDKLGGKAKQVGGSVQLVYILVHPQPCNGLPAAIQRLHSPNGS
jgi:hypothetical protein